MAVKDGASICFSRQARITLCDLFFSAKNVPPVVIHSQLCEAYGEECMSVQHVRKWCREFKNGLTDAHDEQRSGRPSFSDEAIAKLEEAILKDRRVKVRDLSEMIPVVSKSCIHNILRDRLGYGKVGPENADG
ncbi:protein GVQW3-like [Parasteatoda tepidariorum]|uniref:protein GVQW3-like n=1 Tax=Parasteatoda tepidariorum TaxID=114398 RepID=UPI0039BC6F05